MTHNTTPGPLPGARFQAGFTHAPIDTPRTIKEEPDSAQRRVPSDRTWSLPQVGGKTNAPTANGRAVLSPCHESTSKKHLRKPKPLAPNGLPRHH